MHIKIILGQENSQADFPAGVDHLLAQCHN